MRQVDTELTNQLIHVYNDFHGSTEAVALELSKLESNLDAALRPANRLFGVGNYYANTRSSVIFVCGNLLVDITFVGTVAVDDTRYSVAEDMAARLHTYIASRQVTKTQVRRPSLGLAKPLPAAVTKGEIALGGSFEVTMADPELLADETVARSSVGRVLLCTGPAVVAGQPGRKFGFLALSLDSPKIAQNTEVTIVGAHPDTYHPGFRTFTMKVTP